jgi:hypothetical protein
MRCAAGHQQRIARRQGETVDRRIEPVEVRWRNRRDTGAHQLIGLAIHRMHAIARRIVVRMGTTRRDARPLHARAADQPEVPSGPIGGLQVVNAREPSVEQPAAPGWLPLEDDQFLYLLCLAIAALIVPAGRPPLFLTSATSDLMSSL